MDRALGELRASLLPWQRLGILERHLSYVFKSLQL